MISHAMRLLNERRARPVVEVSDPLAAGRHPGSRGTINRPAVVVRETRYGRETESGAVVAGVDGSEIILREMSDGTVEVVVLIRDGISADVGDAVSLAGWSQGRFFSEDGLEWDFDASLIREDQTTYTFSDPTAAKLFASQLNAKQNTFANNFGGSFGWDDVHGVIRDLDGQLGGTVEWSGYRGGQVFAAEGTVGVSVGSNGADGSLSRVHGYAVETKSDDGFTGELSRMSGELSMNRGVEVGPTALAGGATLGYDREVYIERDSSGVPVRLVVSESYSAEANASGGIKFLGTGSTGTVGTVDRLDSVTEFDLRDPMIRRSIDPNAGASDLFSWAEQNSSRGAQTVSTHSGVNSSTSSELLLSYEGTSEASSTTLAGSSYRAPGSSTFEHHVGDMRSQDGMHRQIVTEAGGTQSIVTTGEF